MKSLIVEDAMRQVWNSHWQAVAEELEEDVSALSAVSVMKSLVEFLRGICLAAFQAWLQQADSSEDVIERDGETLRYKLTSPKEFATPCGTLTLPRRLYQADWGGPTHAPVDEAWGMVGQFATPEIREIAAFYLALMTGDEAEQALRKSSLCGLSSTTLKRLAGEVGEWLEEHPEVVEEVRVEEPVPAPTRVLCASLDGSNVRLSEPGGRLGRRPVGASAEPEKTCFKNAMVGSVSLYGEVPKDEKAPERLQSKYISHMPEDNFPKFRAKFESEVSKTLAKCDPDITKVLATDASTILKNYIESHPVLREFELIVDYQHATDHLKMASEALFGKGTAEAKTWLSKQCETLLHHDDGAQRVIRAMGYAKGRRKLTKWCRAEVEKQQTFFRNNGDRMTYASFRERGLPIGSGVVEAAGKMLVKARLCRTGMHWSRTGGQHILSARTIVKSDRWDAVWSRYLNSLQST
jgi:hypothetical protein